MSPVGSFTIGRDHPCLPGHFPGNPIVPGVVLLDEATALILTAEPGRTLAGLPTVRFARPVRPGDLVQVAYAAGRFACTVDGTAVVTGTITLR